MTTEKIEKIIQNHIIVCWNLDAIKINDVYFSKNTEYIKNYIKQAENQNYIVSHGICPDCYKKILSTLKNDN